MRIFAGFVAVVALGAAFPAFASEVSSERRWQREATASASTVVQPAPASARKDTSACECSCARKTTGERASIGLQDYTRH